ncbi:uncharacterized protein LOC105186766 isoform X3 [Harpegnathos saltator]|uniref:uncharacterized protein LOC105186766 isoform X3 n=1 Tax=Harpegnathos saltator TaxID=610380 RepID=UPI000948A7D2|nr:uncharacterized protein LOC105186766 isoform X3 [Harpegnathos saltator]XP_019698595.1 uncharacterized protein LOC105186766 isoform X3 [Harpegnathos saltator]
MIMGVQVEESKIGAMLKKAKFYTSLCLGTTAILAVFGFLFLIPFVVEPAISTILADFSPHAVACVTTDHVYAEGLKNCSWSSCREGCTSAALRCHQIRVNYTRMLFDEFMAKPLGSVPWDVTDTKFFVNTEGCGYPPTVNCSAFAKQYAYRNMGKILVGPEPQALGVGADRAHRGVHRDGRHAVLLVLPADKQDLRRARPQPDRQVC